MPSITGKERIALRKALKESFQTYPRLNRMARDQLDFDLNDETDAGGGVVEALDALIDAMDARGGRPGIVRLIEAARAERPEHPGLWEVEQLIATVAQLHDDVHWAAPVPPESATREGVERVIVDAAGFPGFADVAGRIGTSEFQVCLIGYTQPDGHRTYGTGFLVGPDLVMTNEHVVACARRHALPGSAIELTFGYRSKASHASRHVLVEADWIAASDTRLDYAILRVRGSPGSAPLAPNGSTERGWFKLKAETPQEKEPLLILQHPFDRLEGSPSTLRLTIGFAHAAGQPPWVLRHTANTSEGSSGSPVFTGRMDLVAVHNWGGPTHNEATTMGPILQHLESTGRSALLE